MPMFSPLKNQMQTVITAVLKINAVAFSIRLETATRHF